MLSSTKMYKKGPTHRVEVFFQAGILAIAAVLLFWALTEKDLWQDEAATAVLATRLLKFGRPVAYDGKNLLTIDMQDDDDDASLSKRTKDPQSAIKYFVGEKNFKEDTTWKWQPWGLFAIAAVSIKLLGQTTLAARLPFALAGLATVLFLYRLARRNLENFLTAALASALLVGNVFWILHARQCRYYSVSSLFLVLTLLAYGRWQWGGRGPAAFIAAAWCWFQVDYGTVLPVLVVLFAEAWLADERGWRPTVITGAILAATLLPFVFFYDLRHRGSDPDGTWFGRFNQNLFNTNEYVIPLFIVLAAVFLLATNWKSLAIAERRLLSVACGTLVALSLWIPTVTVYSFLRYIIIAVPVAALVTAWVVARVCQWRWYLAWPAAAILLTTPWLSPAHVLFQAFLRRLISGFAHSEGLCDRGSDQTGSLTGQRDEADTTGKLVGDSLCDSQGKPCLPGSSRTGEGDEACVLTAQEMAERGLFVFAADKCGALKRQVGGATLGRARRRIGQPVAHGSEVASQIPVGSHSRLSDPWPDSAPRSRRRVRGLAAFGARDAPVRHEELRPGFPHGSISGKQACQQPSRT